MYFYVKYCDRYVSITYWEESNMNFEGLSCNVSQGEINDDFKIRQMNLTFSFGGNPRVL